jgi:hypothetical protein
MRLLQLMPRDADFACAGAVSVAGSILTAVNDVALQILGVPVPVVLAAAAGACIARSYAASVSFGRAFLSTTGWTVLGCALAPLAQSLVLTLSARLGVPLALPTNVLAGFAGIVAAAPWWLPIIWPLVLARLGAKGGQS